jgi:diguanylate cyclase (GGDEF)-like protein
MDLSTDLLLSIVFVAIIVNSALVVFLVANLRSRRHRRETAIDQALAASYVDGGAARSAVDAPDEDATSPAGPDMGEPTRLDAPGTDDDGGGLPVDRDGLTGLYDAAAFARLVDLEEARVARYHRPATVVIFELDGLERLIETLGRGAGDRVVAAVADTVRRLGRDADRAARLGPGRFGVLLAETDEIAAINYVERVRRACELWLESGAMSLRLAAGWAGTAGDPPLTEAQRVAIERMYAELRRGARRGDGELVDASTIATGPARIAS